jgi:hypothetical protein
MSLFRRISNLFAHSKVRREIDAELKSHIEMRMEDNIASGMSPEEAQRDALLRFGNPTVIKERALAADAALVLDSGSAGSGRTSDSAARLQTGATEAGLPTDECDRTSQIRRQHPAGASEYRYGRGPRYAQLCQRH